MITEVNNQLLSSPVVVPAPVRTEVWTDHEVLARLRAAQARGATRSVFRPLQDGVLLTSFFVSPGVWSVRVTGSNSFFAPDSLAALARPLLGAGPPSDGVAVFLAMGAAVARRSAPGFALAAAPLYKVVAGRVILVPLPGDVVVPLSDTERTLGQLPGLADDDRLGLRSPRMGIFHEFFSFFVGIFKPCLRLPALFVWARERALRFCSRRRGFGAPCGASGILFSFFRGCYAATGEFESSARGTNSW